MFKKQTIIIAVCSILMLLRIGVNPVVKAAEGTASPWQFETIHDVPISASLAGSCQATETTATKWLFALPVTQELLTEMQNNETETEIVEFKQGNDMIVAEIEGHGTVLIGQSMHVAFVSASTGQVTPLGSDHATVAFSEAMTAPHHDGLRLRVSTNNAHELDLAVGDMLLAYVETEATLQAHECDENGQPPVVSVRITNAMYLMQWYDSANGAYDI